MTQFFSVWTLFRYIFLVLFSYQVLLTSVLAAEISPRASLSASSPIHDVDLLALNDETKALLERSVGTIRNRKERARALHTLLFNQHYLSIQFGDFKTQTAQQTFDSGVGNCISLASLYVSAARHVGLNAKFQTVDVPREWFEEKSFYIVPSHINVAVTTSRKGRELIVEFTDVYLAKDTRLFPSRVISDERVLAEYYNNIGMEFMRESESELAIAFLQKSTRVYPKVGFVWSNLGVLYKVAGHTDMAEKAYKKGLRFEPKNLSILNNLYVLYRQQGENKKASKLAKRVERYSRGNPYYLAKLADSERRLNNHFEALVLLKKAIKINKKEARFYLMMASSYLVLGDHEKSVEYVEVARDLSVDGADLPRFQRKLAYIHSLSGAKDG